MDNLVEIANQIQSIKTDAEIEAVVSVLQQLHDAVNDEFEELRVYTDLYHQRAAAIHRLLGVLNSSDQDVVVRVSKRLH